jgi:hypothetical protein
VYPHLPESHPEQPGPTELVLDLRRPSEVNFWQWKGQPHVSIDGREEPKLTWGRHVRSVTPDIHRVSVLFDVLYDEDEDKKKPRQPAEIVVDTRFGRQTVYYARSWTGWGPGNIGLSPVSFPGRRQLIFQLFLVALTITFWMATFFVILTQNLNH